MYMRKNKEEQLVYNEEIESTNRGINCNSRLQRYGSFMITKEYIEQQILQTAVDIVSQSIIHNDLSDDSEDEQKDQNSKV